MIRFLNKFKEFRGSKGGKIALSFLLILLSVYVFYFQSRWVHKFCTVSNENPIIYNSCKYALYRRYLTPIVLPLCVLLLWFYEKTYFFFKSLKNYIIKFSNRMYSFFDAVSLNTQFLLCTFLTCLFMVIIFYINSGFARLNPFNTAWLSSGDSVQHYMGWVVYRAEDWQFPLGKISLLNYPFGSNIGFTDSLPLFAVFFKLFRNFLPSSFQYIGIFLLSCYLLQAIFSSIIVKNWKCHFYLKLLCAILIAFSPTLIFRENMGHDSLACHWLILAIFYIYFSDEISNKKKIIYNCLILLISAWIHPYITIMLLVLNCALPLKIFLEDKKDYFLTIISFTLPLTLVLISWYIIGYFGSTSELYIKEFGVYSSNLNVLFNSLDKATILKSLPIAMGTQYEGYAYLGFGLILLFVVVCFDKHDKNGGLVFLKRNTSILIFISLCLLIALTNKITFNQFSIEIPINNYLEKFCGIFRSSGRFIWPVYYFIVISILLLWIKSERSNTKKIIFLLLVLILQLIDLKPLYTSSKYSSGIYKTNLNMHNWLDFIGTKNRNLLFYPAFSFKDFNTSNYQDFWLLASLSHCKTNIGYFARSLSKNVEIIENTKMEKNILENTIPEDTFYVTSKKELEVLEKKLNISSIKYHTIDGYIVIKNPLSQLLTNPNQ